VRRPSRGSCDHQATAGEKCGPTNLHAPTMRWNSNVRNGWKADIAPEALCLHSFRMRSEVRRIGIIGASVLLALVICATFLFFFFLLIVFGLSGGSSTTGAAAAGCFLLLIVELIVAARLMLRRRAGYRRSDGF